MRILVRVNQDVSALFVKSTDVHAPLLRPRATYGEAEVPSIRQELRPAVRPLLPGRVRFGHGLRSPTGCQDSVHSASAGPEQDRVIWAPGAAARIRSAAADGL